MDPVWILPAAGFLAGVANAIAGGGTFFTFPVFLATGLPPVVANASNAVAVWPGHALAAWEQRREWSRHPGLGRAIILALIGGSAGAFILSRFPNHTFRNLIPFLILCATLLFTIAPWMDRTLSPKPHKGIAARMFHWLSQLLFAAYGGFFGAGLGVMLMAGLRLSGLEDTHLANAVKNLLGTIISSVAILILTSTGLVAWKPASLAFVGAVVGGWVGPRITRRLSPQALRVVIIAIGSGLTIFYFLQLR